MSNRSIVGAFVGSSITRFKIGVEDLGTNQIINCYCDSFFFLLLNSPYNNTLTVYRLIRGENFALETLYVHRPPCDCGWLA